MATVTTRVKLFLLLLLGVLLIGTPKMQAAENLLIYTPYTKISVAPGQTITYVVDVINHSNAVKNVNLFVSGIRKGWHYSLQAGAWNIQRLALLPNGRKSFTFKLTVPLKINKGLYRFRIYAGNTSIPLEVVVSKQGTYKTELTSEQANMEGQVDATFTYRVKLNNRTASEQLYALKAQAPPGWFVTFRVHYKDVTSVNVKANSSKEITIQIKPSAEAKAGTYKIPVEAFTSSSSSRLMLEAVITGTYGMELSTPSGLLSTSITAGAEKKLTLVVKNTGSSVLKNIRLSAQTPVRWQVSFKPKKINRLEAGATSQVIATIHASDKSIPGDYVTTINATTPETQAKAAFRITVKTSLLWGWVGILIIVLALSGVYYLFRKYGRR